MGGRCNAYRNPRLSRILMTTVSMPSATFGMTTPPSSFPQTSDDARCRRRVEVAAIGSLEQSHPQRRRTIGAGFVGKAGPHQLARGVEHGGAHFQALAR